MDQNTDYTLRGLIYTHVRTLSKGELQRFREELTKALPVMVSEAARRAKEAEQAKRDRQPSDHKQR
jgi:hypothetical protein